MNQKLSTEQFEAIDKWMSENVWDDIAMYIRADRLLQHSKALQGDIDELKNIQRSLPVITDEIDENHESLIDSDRQWTQEAVDFAILLNVHASDLLKEQP